MLIKQSKNSFIRCTEHYGYITNQLLRQDRVYDESGALFLRQISRIPKSIDEIVDHLMSLFEDVSKDELKKDFIDFIEDLANARFVVIANNELDLEKKDVDFSYSIVTPQSLIDDYSQETKENVPDNTQDFFLEEVQGRPLISSIQFELTSRCNERCVHCYIPNEKKDNGYDMPTRKVKSIIDEFAEMGGIHITFSGGEVFLYKDLMELCDYCRRKDLKISILSNLIALKDSQIPLLKKANLSLIQVSLYSMDANIHDQITQVKGSFIKTKESIEKLVKADIPIQISCPLMKINRNGYDKVLEYGNQLNVKVQTDFIMMAESNLDTTNLKYRLSLEETDKVIRDTIEHNIDYQEVTLMKKPKSDDLKYNREKFLKQPVCGVGYDNCCITANGDVYPCAGWQDYVLGNVYKQTLKDIWENSSRVKELRKVTEASFPQCIDCEAFNYCSRCLVRNYNESNGDMFNIPKHFCDVAFLNMRLCKEYESFLKSKIYQS